MISNYRMTATPEQNRKLIAEEFSIFKPALIAHSDTEMDLKSLKLFHEVLAFNHRAEPDRYHYTIEYEVISKTTDKRNVQKLISQEIVRIASRMQSFVFKIDKKKMYEVTGEKNAGSISPFDRIIYEGNNIKVVLGTTFKKLLVRYQQFYLGDARTVRSLNHKASIHMYWLIISHSWKGSSFEVTLEELKVFLGCPGVYEDRWDNFRKKILEPIQAEFQDTWCEFSYQTQKKGRKIHALVFEFKSDAQIIRSIINESPYPFEQKLQQYKMKYTTIMQIREQVKKGNYTEQDVEKVIQHAQQNKTIRSKPGYIVKALTERWFEKMAIQTTLEISPSSPVPTNGHWGEVQQYWNFSLEQMKELRKHYNEHTLRMVHYKKKLFFERSTPVEEVFQAFLSSAVLS